MSRLKHRNGQGLVEYIILVTLMGIALIAIVRTLGSETRTKFQDASTEIRRL